MRGTWRTTPAAAIQRGRHKLVHFFEGERWELYDLVDDVSETTDLSARMPELAEELRDALRAWWSETGAFVPSEPNPRYVPAG